MNEIRWWRKEEKKKNEWKREWKSDWEKLKEGSEKKEGRFYGKRDEEKEEWECNEGN